MAVTQYVGARYVPVFADPIDWTSDRAYEPLTIVLHNGDSYTTKQYTPKGIDISDTRYWALTANYNAQMDAYRNEVKQFDNRIATNTTAITAETTRATTAEKKNADAITANANAIAANTTSNTEHTNMLAGTTDSGLKALIDTNSNKLSTIYPLDTAPVKNSTKGITSGSVYNAINIANNIYAKPEDYGAIGDGTTDDSAAIQSAINNSNCVALSSGKRYMVSTSINLKPNLTIIGANRDSTILLGSNAQIILPSNADANYGLQLIGFTIRANDTRTNTAIVLNDMVYSLLDNLCVRSDNGVDNYNGLLIQKTDFNYPAYANVVRNCFFQRAAFYLKDSTDNIISGNKFWANDMSANAVKLMNNCNNNCFTNNHFITTNDYVSFDAEGELHNLRFTNNYFDGSKFGFFTSLLVTSNISGNHFYNNSIRAFSVNYMRCCTLAENVFTDCCTADDSRAVGDVALLQESYANVFKGNMHYRQAAPKTNTPAYVIQKNPTLSKNIICDTSIMYPYTYYKALTVPMNCVIHNCYPEELFPTS